MKGIAIIIVLFFFLPACGKIDQRNSPIAIKGVIDLRSPTTSKENRLTNLDQLSEEKGWDFQKDGIIRLDGEWEFYWKELIEPEKFVKGSISSLDFLNVPGAWNGFKSNQKNISENEPITGDGFATYRLKVFLNSKENLSLKLPIVVSAYRLFINGTLCASAGVLGANSASSTPQYFTHVIRLPQIAFSEFDLVMHVSNFHHRKGGLRNPILLGLDQDIHRKREMNLFLYIFPSGAFVIIGLYHFGLYFYRRKDGSALWFGVYSLLMSINSLLNGEYYFHHIFPGIPYEIGRKLEYISQYLSIPALVIFIEILYPIGKRKLLSRIIKNLAYLLSLFVLVFPARIFTHSLQVMEPVILTANLYCIYILIISMYHQKDGALIYLISFLIFTAICINDIFHSNQIVYTGYYLPLGMVIFIFSQTFFLSRRFTHAFIQVEEFTTDLEKKIIDRTRELNHSLKLIRHDLSVAKKIQQNMLFVNNSPLDELKIVSTYAPMTEVGGDFYGVTKVNETLFRIFLSDATGHGIQAALMTMAIKGIYDSLKHYELAPHVVMGIFNREFIERYISLNSFLTAIIVDIDTKNEKLRYASAGHPSCALIQDDKIRLLKRTGGMIGLGRSSTYESFEYNFGKKDRLYLFTDGIFEEFNFKNQEFGEERLYPILTNGRESSIEETMQTVLNHLDLFLEGRPKQDDLTFLGIEYK